MYKLIKKTASYLLLALISFYRYIISPVTGSNCRYHPSCSSYAQQAIRIYGPFVGSKMAITRILSCRPGKPGGYDPVPEQVRRDNPHIHSSPESTR